MSAGIRAIELYVPHLYVDQAELEVYDGVSTGKYTSGIGQREMAVCSDREDTNSICLTVVHRLLKNYNIDRQSIGLLVVGTESSLDKSKSVKSQLMRLFPDNETMAGVDCIHACFGGTQAMLHADDWLNGRRHDGRHALVVMGDIAVYEAGPARCTGGAGAVAILMSREAPLQIEKEIGLCMRPTYDFFKPNTYKHGAYPMVDGALSLQTYVTSMMECHERLGRPSLDDFDHVIMHSPFTKLVNKAFARLAEGELVKEEVRWMDKENTQVVRDAMAKHSTQFDAMCRPSLTFASRCGNMYTPTLLAGLVSVIAHDTTTHKQTGRCLLFSYGSGAAACLFTIKSTGEMMEEYNKIRERARSTVSQLDNRVKLSPEEFNTMLDERENVGRTVPCTPTSPINETRMTRETYYLREIDAKHRRNYALYE